jgi:hypothetical protein
LFVRGFYVFTRYVSIGLERVYGVLQNEAKIGRFFSGDRVGF